MYRNPVAITGAATPIAHSPDLLVGAHRDVGSEPEFRTVAPCRHHLGLVAP